MATLSVDSGQALMRGSLSEAARVTQCKEATDGDRRRGETRERERRRGVWWVKFAQRSAIASGVYVHAASAGAARAAACFSAVTDALAAAATLAAATLDDAADSLVCAPLPVHALVSSRTSMVA